MGKIYDAIDANLASFLEAQRIFFVASAPVGANGHINLSPKGLDSFRLLGPRQVAYADLTGSGIETVAHVRENGRLVLLFCAFEGPPKIVRLHGHAEVIDRSHAEFAALVDRFPHLPGLRSIIRLDIERISDSCGHGVPLYEYRGERNQLLDWATHKGESGLTEYRRSKNAASIDGLPGFEENP